MICKYMCANIYRDWETLNHQSLLFAIELTNVLQTISFSCNFLVYALLNVHFRHAVRDVVCCRRWTADNADPRSPPCHTARLAAPAHSLRRNRRPTVGAQPASATRRNVAARHRPKSTSSRVREAATRNGRLEHPGPAISRELQKQEARQMPRLSDMRVVGCRRSAKLHLFSHTPDHKIL